MKDGLPMYQLPKPVRDIVEQMKKQKCMDFRKPGLKPMEIKIDRGSFVVDFS